MLRKIDPPFFDTEDADYRQLMEETLLEHQFPNLSEEFRATEQFIDDLTEHQYRRVDRFHAHLIPWVSRVFDLTDARVIEVGSGTGSSTLAFAPYVNAIHCFELEDNAVEVAKARLGFWGFDHVIWEQGLFDRNAEIVQQGHAFDVILLVAVLEHVHFSEFKEIMMLAYERLAEGGIILIAETPNRLAMADQHTSWLQFFQWLPHDIAVEYAKFSPRQSFAHDIKRCVEKHGPNSSEVKERLVRWGNGISYHDFELVLGPEVHDFIVLDGWEEEIRPLAPIFRDDEVLLDIFARWDLPANKAFCRSWLYFVLQKPPVAN